MSSKPVAAEVFPPGEHLADELAARGWTVAQLAGLMDQPAHVVSGVLDAQVEITRELAESVAAALGLSARVWLNLEAAYKSQASTHCT